MSRQEVLSRKTEKENENAEDELHSRERTGRRIEGDSEDVREEVGTKIKARQGSQRKSQRTR
jgi:hypothetical protein